MSAQKYQTEFVFVFGPENCNLHTLIQNADMTFLFFQALIYQIVMANLYPFIGCYVSVFVPTSEGDKSTFSLITGVQFFQIELKPVRKFSVDANMKRFQDKILYDGREPTLKMGQFRVLIYIYSFLKINFVDQHANWVTGFFFFQSLL